MGLWLLPGWCEAGLGGSEHREAGGGHMGSGLHLCGGPVETPVLLSCSQRSLDRVWPLRCCFCGDSPSLQSQSHR